MNFNEEFNGVSDNQNKKGFNPFLAPSHYIVIYTFLTVLKDMKNELGLEAMLEYQHKYAEIIERNNPRLKDAVKKALGLMCVKKMYRDVCYEEGIR